MRAVALFSRSRLSSPRPSSPGMFMSERTRWTGWAASACSADKTLIERGRQFALNNYITKPFTVAQLRGAIEAVVGKLS